MNWTAATTAAAQQAQRWTLEGGPGGAIILFDTHDIRAEACGGLASLEIGLPFAATTAVRYASISKHFLNALLLAGGPIRHQDRLGDHLPLHPALAGVEVGRALDMTGGLPDVVESLNLLAVPVTARMDRAALLRFACALDGLNFPPGTQISYSNTGYRLVQAVLESKGIDYAAALHARFFRPLGLGITLPEDETDPVPNLAGGYWKSPRGWLHGRYGLHISASGGLAGSARDLAAWCQALLADAGPTEGLLARLGAPRRLADGTVTGYGLGIARYPVPGVIAVGHSGSLPGFRAQFMLAPALGAGVVVVSNRDDTDATGIAMTVLAALAGTELPEPAAGALPAGRFVAEGAPAWIEHEAGKVTFLGATETVYPAEDGVAGRSVHLPIALRPVPGAIEGSIGHRPYRVRPVEPGLQASPAWSGTWVHDAHNARLTIEVTEGVARLHTGTGPLRETLDLAPLRADLALAERGAGTPSAQRLALHFTGETLRLIANRSRMLTFRRA